MQLRYLSITGADDAVDPRTLYELSDRFDLEPHGTKLEWGILFHPSKANQKRYPERTWIYQFLRHKPNYVRCAAHLCGQAVELFIHEGNEPLSSCYNTWKREMFTYFNRLQVNANYDDLYRNSQAQPWVLEPNLGGMRRAITQFHMATERNVIPQHNQDTARFVDDLLDRTCGAQVLFDASRGNGVWIGDNKLPTLPDRDIVGYAGGIGPDNVTDLLERLESELPEYQNVWIDMESGVRDKNNEFDLDKVGQVLSEVSDFCNNHTT